ncbi:MAG: ankyrin repeat domain-containing protein [Sulfobacillus sp.]
MPVVKNGTPGPASLAVSQLLKDKGPVEERSAVLRKAAKDGNINQVRLVLASGADPGRGNRHGERASDIAIAYGHPEIALVIARWIASRSPYLTGSPVQGGQVSPESIQEGKKLVMYAERGDIGYVQDALSKGADPDGLVRGVTALGMAASQGRTSVVQFLLAHGADVNEQDVLGYSALMWAAQMGQFEIVKILLTHGARVDVKTREYGVTALMLAARIGRYRIVKILLIKGANANTRVRRYLETPLMAAAETGRIEIVRLLMEYGADKNLKDSEGETAAEIARRYSHSEIAEMIDGKVRHRFQ